MNYQKAYDSLILKALKRGLTKKELSFQTEKHHIVPRCLGGKDEKTNYVLLTPKEHYVAHHLLYKIYPNDNGIFLAYRMMAIMDSPFSNRGKFCISANEYQHIKEEFIRSRIGTKHSPETLAKMRKPRRFTDNMRKPKTATALRIAECERRKITFAGEGNPMYGSSFKWYNDGKRNYRITDEKDAVGLTRGKLEKRKTK